MARPDHGLDIHVDDLAGDQHTSHTSNSSADAQVVALRSLSPAQLQNAQQKTPSDSFSKSHRTRSSHAQVPTTLETVPEVQPSALSNLALDSSIQHRFLELSASHFPEHPILAAARTIPPAKVQLDKHQCSEFEWVLAITQPTGQGHGPLVADSPSSRKLYLGCNLYPQAAGLRSSSSSSQLDCQRVLLLVTPLEGDDKSGLKGAKGRAPSEIMAVPEGGHNTLALPGYNETHNQEIPRFIITISDTDETPSCNALRDASDSDSIARIEDSFEALDQLEDQLEAFDEAAMFKRVTISDTPVIETRSPATPAAKPRSAVSYGSTPVRPSSIAKPTQSTLRKSHSMTSCDSPKVKREEKPLIQVASKVVIPRPASTMSSKPAVKSTKQPTIPTPFELPGEATARRLKEKREARAAARAAEEEAFNARSNTHSSSLRRSQSTRSTTVPNFELPGEAISRRKREERAAQRRAQDLEDRKRREFKARPIGIVNAPSYVPRDTAASRARQQNRSTLSIENHDVSSIPRASSKRHSMGVYPSTREPLESASNQADPRGRGLTNDSRHLNRAVSHGSSTGSVGRTSSISNEDLEQQRRKGQGVFRRDSSHIKDWEREKREREEQAKTARAEAAERSRQLSREWAAKQARKRATIGSLRDLAI